MGMLFIYFPGLHPTTWLHALFSALYGLQNKVCILAQTEMLIPIFLQIKINEMKNNNGHIKRHINGYGQLYWLTNKALVKTV